MAVEDSGTNDGSEATSLAIVLGFLTEFNHNVLIFEVLAALLIGSWADHEVRIASIESNLSGLLALANFFRPQSADTAEIGLGDGKRTMGFEEGL